MAVSLSSYAGTQISASVTTNNVATFGVGMTDQNNGDVVAIVPLGANSPAGIYFYKRTSGTDTLLSSAGSANLPAINQIATFIVNVNGSTVTVFVNGNQAATFSDPTLGAGLVGIGSNGAAFSSAEAQFSNILLGSTPVVTAASACYDQWNNPVSCSCWNGTAYYTCSYPTNNCNDNNCNTCTNVYGTSIPCQGYNTPANAQSCNRDHNWNGNNTNDNHNDHANSGNWNGNVKGNNNSNDYWMNSQCHSEQTGQNTCDGVWSPNANGMWQESCY